MVISPVISYGKDQTTMHESARYQITDNSPPILSQMTNTTPARSEEKLLIIH